MKPNKPKKFFFTKDPVIQITDVYCPMCHKVMGTETNCEKDKEPAVVNMNNIMMPIFSPGCAYKMKKLLILNINYPASSPLLTRLRNILGVVQAEPNSKYQILIEYGRAFEKEAMKKSIISTYNDFIKYCQTCERSLANINRSKNKQDTVYSVTLPNNKTVEFKCPADNLEIQEAVLSSMVIDFPGTKYNTGV